MEVIENINETNMPGIYRHFKGNYYKLISVGKSSEDESFQVVYQALHGDCRIWTRPLSMWNETVEYNGKKVKRFEPVDPKTLEIPIDKIALVCIKDGKILMTRSRGKEKFYFPGGKREQGESDIETLVRELKEETGIDIKVETVNYYGTYYSHRDGNPAEKIMKMTCYCAKFSGHPKPSNEIDKICRMTYKDRNKTNGVGMLIFDELYKKGDLKL